MLIRYFFKKFISALIALYSVITITFFLMKMIPGDPFSEEKPTPRVIRESLNKYYGLDQPIFLQYITYLKGLLHFDFGPSLKYTDRSVNTILKEGFPVSAFLGIHAFFLAFFVGIYLGVISAYSCNTILDRQIMIWSVVAISNPSFVTATFLQYVFAIKLKWFPVACWGTYQHLVLPMLAVSTSAAAGLARLMRASMLNVLSRDYVQLARAKGMPKHIVLWRHALPEAILPLLGVFGPLVANILIGSFVVERIFGIPGVGQWWVKSIANRDYPLILGMTVFYSALLLVFNFIIDILHAIIDPRIRERIQCNKNN